MASAEPVEPQAAAGSLALDQVATAPLPAQQQLQAEKSKKAAARDRQTEAQVAPDHLYTAPATSASSGPSAKSATAAAADAPAAASGETQESRDKSVSAFATFRGTQAFGSFTRPGIHLPSGLAVASLASANHRMLAIDTAGAAFLSGNGESAWHGVTPQWTGRAVLVRARTIQALGTAPASVAEPTGTTGASPSAPSAATVFELVNDKNQIWLSADGATWIAK